MQANQPAQNSATLAQNSARCQNSDKSVQPDASIGGCNAVIQDTARNLAAAYYYRGAAHQAKRDFDRAITDYSQAISIDPNDADYLNGRAGAYEAKNDMSRAMADYDQAIQLNPKSVYAYNNRGATYQRKGDYARASADYGEVTRLQPKNPDAWAARCWVRAAGGREVQQALSDCNEAIKLKADAPDVLDTPRLRQSEARQDGRRHQGLRRRAQARSQARRRAVRPRPRQDEEGRQGRREHRHRGRQGHEVGHRTEFSRYGLR